MDRNEFPLTLDTARRLIADVPYADPVEVVRRLSIAREAVDTALNEAMVQAALGGASHRAIAEAAGVAPNTVPARLAHTSLAGYAEGSRVSAQGVTRARYDLEQGRPAPATEQAGPMRFRRRTSGGTA